MKDAEADKEIVFRGDGYEESFNTFLEECSRWCIRCNLVPEMQGAMVVELWDGDNVLNSYVI